MIGEASNCAIHSVLRPAAQVRTEIAMGTVVTMQVLGGERDAAIAAAIAGAIDCAFGWFHEIEERCTRFSERSELMQLCGRVGEAVPVSSILFEAIQFALMVAEETEGAFDPTVGSRMMARGFNREYRSGETIGTAVQQEDLVSYRDVQLDPERRTIMLLRPLTLDLGAVAKGLAVDMAARELQPFYDFAIDAGGDLYLGGLNPEGGPWSVGIRHPRRDGELIDRLLVSNQAVCTSGDYERQAVGLGTGEHHILDPRTGVSPASVASATVVGPGAMLADALATAAFVLGPQRGIELLNRMDVAGLVVTADLQRYETAGLHRAA